MNIFETIFKLLKHHDDNNLRTGEFDIFYIYRDARKCEIQLFNATKPFVNCIKYSDECFIANMIYTTGEEHTLLKNIDFKNFSVVHDENYLIEDISSQEEMFQYSTTLPEMHVKLVDIALSLDINNYSIRIRDDSIHKLYSSEQLIKYYNKYSQVPFV